MVFWMGVSFEDVNKRIECTYDVGIEVSIVWGEMSCVLMAAVATF